jgi:hypothetical protein
MISIYPKHIKIFSFSMLLLLPFNIMAESSSGFCATRNQDNITSRNTLMTNFPRCWAGMFSTKFGVTKTIENGMDTITIPWHPCQFRKNGFRAEISQPFEAPFSKIIRKDTWGIEDEKAYPSVLFSWSFKIEDPTNLIKNWASNAFIAQWHSYSHPLDKSVRGGSPVIGLRYNPGELPDTAYITLTSKIFRSSGFCNDSDTPVKASYCNKSIAREKIKLNEFNDLKLYIKWDRGFNIPGSVKPVLNGKLMSSLKGHNFLENGEYVFPNKQNAQPNHLKLGWYVIAQDKKKQYIKSLNIPDKPLDFCQSKDEIRLKIKGFSFSSF